MAKIENVHIYPNKDIKIDLFFFEAEAVDGAYIIVKKNGDKLKPDVSPLFPIFQNQLSNLINKYLFVEKGSDLYFKLFIEGTKRKSCTAFYMLGFYYMKHKR